MPKNHYVPQSILKNFSKGKKTDQVYFLVDFFLTDKNQDQMQVKSMQVIPTSVKNLCNEEDFYSFLGLKIPNPSSNSDEISQTIDYDYDQLFNKLDNDIAPIVKKVINDDSIDNLNCQQTKTLAEYVVYQYHRTPAAKKVAQNLTQDEKNARILQGATLLDEKWINDISNILRQKLILKLIKPSNEVQFIISDSPVLWDPTAEGIYFPISPNHCLCYQKSSTSQTLDSICINYLEYLASTKFNIAGDEQVLKDILEKKYQEYIKTISGEQPDSYWKCILRGEGHNQCCSMSASQNKIFSEFVKILPSIFTACSEII